VSPSFDRVVEIAIANAPLLGILAYIYWRVTPRLLKATLLNGGGDAVRRIIREENADQSKSIDEKFTHMRERMAVLETRIADHLKAS
jgi:hypothetical protein